MGKSTPRFLGAAVVLSLAGLGSPVAAAAGPAPAVAPARPVGPQARAKAIAAQEARVKALAAHRHRPAYAEALLALARLRREAGDARGALAGAREAAAAFDAQVELHKSLSDVLPTYDDARAERAAALALGLRRDEAFFLVAELAQATGDEATAVRHYVLLVQSQADQPRGREAYAALRRLGWAASPAPAGVEPSSK
jgi:hypothetical protein